MQKVYTSDNYAVNVPGKLGFNSSDSNVCENINCISQMLNCDRFHIISATKWKKYQIT